jgi:predicted nucleic acid-binding protein
MIVADASVWINLVATGQADRVLRTLTQQLVITDVAFGELVRGRPKGRKAADAVASLIHMDLVRVIALEAADEPVYLSLVSGAASETLDDGEAATLACAHRLLACALIDERKATRLAAQRFSHLDVRSTTDLLLDPEVRSAFGDNALADALFNALTDARMRVPDHHSAEIVRILGSERLARCYSLPARLRETPAE